MSDDEVKYTPPPLNDVDMRALRREYVRRARSKGERLETYKPTQRELDLADLIEAKWFDKQRAFFTSTARRRVAFCSRRAGKSLGTAIWFLGSMLRFPTALHLYVAQTSAVAKLYMWPELKRMLHEYNLPFEVNENDLTIKHKRGMGALVLKGADNAKQIQNLRGPHWKKVALDEAATFGNYFEELIMEILGAALRDTNGELILTGTAGKMKHGIFYEACHELRRRRSDNKPVYELHRWTLQDNPYLSEDARNEDLIMDDEGFSGPSDPRYLREYKGIWAVGDSERVFAGFTEEKNVYEGSIPPNHEWRHILGCDFGWHDESAMCVLAYSRTSAEIYVREIWGKSRLYTDDIAAKMLELKNKYGVHRFVGDCGGYGKAVVMHLQRDYHIHVEQAQKREKLDHIAFLNSAFQRSEVKIHKHECKRLIVQLHEVAWNESKTNAGNHERDDLCFAAGTLIATRRGNVPIELIREGDEAWTRKGWRTIANAGFAGVSPVMQLNFTHTTLVCTPSHQYMVGEERVCAKDLEKGASLTSIDGWSGRAACGQKMRSAIFAALDSFCIGPNGSTIGDQFRRDTKFTTKITTVATIACQTWNAFIELIIAHSMIARGRILASNAPLQVWQSSKRRWPRRRQNEALLRKPDGLAENYCFRMRPVSSVAGPAIRAAAMDAKFAPTNVVRKRVAKAASTISTLIVSFAESLRELISTANQSVAHSHATQRLETSYALKQPQKVYRISVESEHEYFANGIHTLNCFAMTYGWRAAKSAGSGSDVRAKSDDPHPERTALIKEKNAVLKRKNEDSADINAFADAVTGRNRGYPGVSRAWSYMLGVGRR